MQQTLLAFAMLGAIHDPCRDVDEIADAHARRAIELAELFYDQPSLELAVTLRQARDAELCARAYILSREDADLVDWYSLAAALRDAGYPVTSWFREIGARCPPWDSELLYLVLGVLAEETDDPNEALALCEQADLLQELTHGEEGEEVQENGHP